MLERAWRVLRSADAARELKAKMAADATLRPWTVVSTAAGESEPRFDMASLHDQLEGVSHLVVIHNGAASLEWGVLTAERESVFGGAARVYPAGYGSGDGGVPAPIRLPHPGQNPARMTERLISDALTMAQESGVFAHGAQHHGEATAVITGFVGDERALVKLSGSGEMGTLASETTFPGVPLGWLFSEGQEIQGRFDTAAKRFLVEVPSATDEQLVEHFPYSSVTWALVMSVGRQSGVLRIHPGRNIEFVRDELSANPKDRVDLLLAPGEVVPVRVYRSEQGVMRVRMDDIDDDEVVFDALSFGAGPWLVEGRDLVEAQPEEDELLVPVDSSLLLADLAQPGNLEPERITPTPARPVPGPGLVPAIAQIPAPAAETPVAPPAKGVLAGVQLELATARAQMEALGARLQALGGDKAEELYRQIREERNHAIIEGNRFREDLRQAKADLAEWRKKGRENKTASASSGPTARQDRFSSLEQWLREEVRRAWISVYTPHERTQWGVDDTRWVIGPSFMASLAGLNDSQVRRLTKLVLHIVSGRSDDEQLFEVHPLREGEGIGEANVIRGDGALCLRAYLEEGVPQSRRLHYWHRSGSPIELSRVVQHDDMRP